MDIRSPMKSPKILETISDAAINTAAAASSFKKRKIGSIGGPKHEISHRSTLPHSKSYSKSHIPGRQAKVEHLNHLRKLAEQKQAEINELNTQIMTLQTRKHNLEFENFKKDDAYLGLRAEAGSLEGQIDELGHYEKQSLLELEQKLEITNKELRLKHDLVVQSLKETASKDIESFISNAQQQKIKIRDRLNNECEEISQTIEQQQRELNNQLEKLHKSQDEKYQEMRGKVKETLEGVSRDIEETDRRRKELISSIEAVSRTKLVPYELKYNDLKQKEATKKKAFSSKFDEINALTSRVEAMKAKVANITNILALRKKEIVTKEASFVKMTNDLMLAEKNRRFLHNKLQELRGNIRVFCRIRPPAQDDENLSNFYYADDDLDMNAFQRFTISKQSPDSTDHGQLSRAQIKSYTFGFDKVFSPSVTNPEIFEELSQLIQSSLDGFNVCVFAYGQTGSGKTWTMSHPDDGMIPLSMQKIFADIEDLKQSGWEYKVEAQFLEIYNDTIVDLLSPKREAKNDIIHDDNKGTTRVTNATSVMVESAQHAQSLFEKTAKNRSTASTASNERSSRSHSICIIKLDGYNRKNNQKSEGCLNLVDLAGSERWIKSQVQGDRLREMQHINKSLSSLGEVVCSLANASKTSNQHISYRNSKLTYLLKHSLGGKSKTLMFVNISPSLSNFNETVNSLRFASKVCVVKQGTNSR